MLSKAKGLWVGGSLEGTFVNLGNRRKTRERP
jgi:lipid-binding SYLF domain-containing protein